MHLCLNPWKSISRFVRYFPLLFLLLCISGCGTSLTQFYFGDLFGKKTSSETQKEKDAALLAQEGMQKMREKDYVDALKAFQQLKERYPYSQFSALAELKIGDANFYRKDYSDAVLAYEEFSRLHPRNDVIPYVLYQIGMCHFLSFSSIERDPEETQAAIEAFQRLIQVYPQTEYARKAGKQLFECQKRIVAHEFSVGEFYYRCEEYRSSKARLDKISQIYPQAVKDLGYDEAIRRMLVDCDRNISKGDKQPSIWTRLGF